VFALFVVLLFVVPIVELYLIVQVAGSIGALETIFVLVAISLLGAWLLKHEGLGVLGRIQARLDQGQLPTNELVDGLLIMLGAALLFTPGFLTDVVGLVLLFPPTRVPVRALTVRHYRRRFERGDLAGAAVFGVPGSMRFYSSGSSRGRGDIWDVESVEDEDPGRGPSRPPELGQP
jgi:UPF0716 protein FxsA